MASSLRQSHVSLTGVLPQEPDRIKYYICLCVHLGGVCEIQTSLDVSDLFKGHEELTSCSALSIVTCFCC